MRKKHLWIGWLVVTLVLFATACSSNGAKSSGTQPAGETPKESAIPEESGENNVLTIGVRNDMQTLDIHNHGNLYTEAVQVNLFNYLFRKDNKGNIEPDLVDEYNKVNDTTWHFTLKKGVAFHNGDPFTAEDVKFTLERVARDESLFENANFKMIKEIRVIDDTSFDLITSSPDPILLNRLSKTGGGMLPKDYIEKEGWEAFLKNPVGTGPYQLVEWKKDERVVLEKYKNYFEGNVSDWDKVIFRTIPETSTRVGELLTGGVDIAVELPPSEWDRVDGNNGTSIIKANTTQVIYLVVRSTDGTVTANPKVREAIDYAIDNKAIVDNLLKGTGTPTRTFIVPEIPGSDEDLYNSYRYDPAKAKQLLKEAGYENGLQLALQTPNGQFSLDADTAQMTAGMLEQVGIKVDLEILDPQRSTTVSKSNKNKELMLNSQSNTFLDPAQVLEMFDSKRFPDRFGYSNPQVDELLEKAATNMNEQERAEQYKQVQEILAQDLPVILFHQAQYYVGVSDRVQYEPRMDKALFARFIKKAK